MGRELRRVPLDFSWPDNKPWQGYINPHYDKASDCPSCGGSGNSPACERLHALWYGRLPFKPSDRGSEPFTETTPEVRAFAERNVRNAPQYYGDATEANILREARRLCTLFNSRWSHHLNDEDVKALLRAGRLMDFTHKFTPGEGWKPKAEQVVPTAREVNLWSISGGFGHDSFNAYCVISAEAERQGAVTVCSHCNGEGRVWPTLADKEAYEGWERSDPPSGEGYQLWETVSEGSPISPVFSTPEGLATWLSENKRGRVDDGATYEQWMAFIVGPGWAPSLMGVGDQLVSGVQGMAAMHLQQAGRALPAP